MKRSELKYIINELKKVSIYIKRNDLASYHSSLVNLYVFIYRLKELKLEYVFILLLPKIRILIKTNADVIDARIKIARTNYIFKSLEILRECIKECEKRLQYYED